VCDELRKADEHIAQVQASITDTEKELQVETCVTFYDKVI
jgi:hypothetical protein